MALSYFSLDGVKSSDYGVIISKAGVFNAPARSYESVPVPGKNGDVIFDNGRYENVDVPYEAGIVGRDKLDSFRAWLLSHTGYCRIEDTYHKDEYRIGMPVNGLVPSLEVMLKLSKFTLHFNCKPQRFLKSGEQTTTLTASGSITNPTLYTAKPIIRVYGRGALGVGSETVTIASHSLSYIDLDCDIEDSTCGATNANGYVTLTGDHYPTFAPGANRLSLASTITRVIITPRWWTL